MTSMPDSQRANRFERAGATVTRDDEPRANLARGSHAGLAQIVSVFESPRDERHWLRAEIPETASNVVAQMPSTS